jgi:RimJ/RimL family protein N-acetyltransferase
VTVPDELVSLTGVHVRLRPLSSDDIPSLLKQAPSFSSAADLEDEEVRLRRMVANQPTLADHGFWSLAVEHAGELVGDIQTRAPHQGFPPGVCEIGITLQPRVWGRGIGTEAVRLLTAHLQATGWPRVQASTATTNSGMIRVLKRCGYGFEGVLRSFAPDDAGGRADYEMYACIDSSA